MRVLVGPRCDLRSDEVASKVAESLAGFDGIVVPLIGTGTGSFSRQLSAAEVHVLRQALLGADPEHVSWSGLRADPMVGYLCRGKSASAAGSEALVAVTDHADLTWRSPLVGPNDERIGPRFPVTADVYAPEAVITRTGTSTGLTLAQGIVAGVADDGNLTRFESGVVDALSFRAVSSELLPVALIAAHLGFRLAAAVMVLT